MTDFQKLTTSISPVGPSDSLNCTPVRELRMDLVITLVRNGENLNLSEWHC